MARAFKPAAPFTVPMKLLTPVLINDHGARKKKYSDPKDSEVFFGAFRTFGGSERDENGVITLNDTAVIDTWFDPAIRADCAVYVCETKLTYEIISEPEDIEMRHQYLQFKVLKVGGKP